MTKRNRLKWAMFALTYGLSMAVASAQTITVAGGAGIKEKSVYSAMLGDLAGVCADSGVTIQEKTTSGSVENLQMLRDNKVQTAIVQTDVLFAAKMDNATSVAPIKTVFALHPEPVHLAVRADAKTEGGVTVLGKNFGGDTIVFDQAEKLKGRSVGAVGGSAVSARILGDMLRLGWKVVEYNKTSELLAALETYKIDGAIIVAASGSPAVQAITPKFKLLPLRGNADTAAVYVPTKVQYKQLNGNRAVDTISEQALLVTRTWKSDEMLTKLAALRACFKRKLATIQDAEGTNPAWQEVNADDTGKWPMYDLPAVKGGK